MMSFKRNASSVLMHDEERPFVVAPRTDVTRRIPYLPGESLAAFSQRIHMPIENVVKLNSNESPYSPPAAALHALSAHNWYNQYADTNSLQLKDALSRYTQLDTSHIVLGHGSMEVLHLLWHLFLGEGDALICCPPTFSLYTTVTSQCGAQMHNVKRTANYEIDLAAVKAAITPETKLIALCSPNNPTGNPISDEVLIELLATGRIIVVDEAYVEFSGRPQGYAHLVPKYRNLVVIRTLSKWAGLAGLRVGYGLFPHWIVELIKRSQYPFEVNSAGHLAAVETLNHVDEVLANVQRIIQERDRLFAVLARQTYLAPIPSQGNFILTRLTDKRVSLELIKQTMEAHGILIRYFPHLDGDDFIRITVGLPEHTDRVSHALEAISSHL